MAGHKIYWAIIHDEPTRCTVRDKIHGDKIWLVHPTNLPPDCTIFLREDYVYESKEECIQHALEILLHKMEALKKELEKKHVKR